jgi:hypothetical protein
MSSKGNTFENELLECILNNADIPLIGDAGGIQNSVANGDLFLSLHTADPGEAGVQTTNETAYTGYARVAIDRDGAAWTVTANSASPAANQDFGECTAAPGAALTHFAVGTATSGAGKILYYGALTPNITMATGVIPRIKTTSTITED